MGSDFTLLSCILLNKIGSFYDSIVIESYTKFMHYKMKDKLK